MTEQDCEQLCLLLETALLGFRLEIFGGRSWLNFFFALSDCKDRLIFISGCAVAPESSLGWHSSGDRDVGTLVLGMEWVGRGGPASVSHLLQLKPRP